MTPLERAAHALRIADSCDFFEAENKDYPAMVRAVLLAIREPSEGMRDAGGRALGDYDDIWQAMIDAALEEG